MKRSRLLSQDMTIGDAMLNGRTINITNNFKRNSTLNTTLSTSICSELTPEEELFKNICYKKINSVDTNDSEEGSIIVDSKLTKSFMGTSLECEKIRIKIEKSSREELQRKRIDPNRYIWKEEKEEKCMKRVMTLRHLSEVESKKSKINVMGLSILLNPHHK